MRYGGARWGCAVGCVVGKEGRYNWGKGGGSRRFGGSPSIQWLRGVVGCLSRYHTLLRTDSPILDAGAVGNLIRNLQLAIAFLWCKVDEGCALAAKRCGWLVDDIVFSIGGSLLVFT